MTHFIHRETIDETLYALKCSLKADLGFKAALEYLHPFAAVYTRVEGGYIAFDTYTEYETWKAQR